KKWADFELNSLFALETVDDRRILPIWHNVDLQDVKDFRAELADRVGLDSSVGVEELSKQIVRRFELSLTPREEGDWPTFGTWPAILQGLWSGLTGRLRIQATDESYRGFEADFDWYGKRWVGTLAGSVREPLEHEYYPESYFASDGSNVMSSPLGFGAPELLLPFTWSWKVDNSVGSGFFRVMWKEVRFRADYRGSQVILDGYSWDSRTNVPAERVRDYLWGDGHELPDGAHPWSFSPVRLDPLSE
ncbi:MAG: hypothetical protein AAF394_19110, partial [Planctomycetota bacterium]